MNLFKKAAVTLLAYGGPNWFWRAATRAARQPLVVAYHRVLSGSERFVDRTQGDVTAAEFEKQVTYLLRTRRWTTLGELVSGADGAGPAFAVTFDDGYGDTYRVAFPILRELGMTATAFITTEVASGHGWFWWDRLAYALSESIGKKFQVGGRYYHLENEEAADSAQAALTPRLKSSACSEAVVEDIENQLDVAKGVPEGLYLSWEEVRALYAEGWEIGAHSQTHRILTSLTREEARADIEACSSRIEREIGERPRLFAYPNGQPGDYDDGVIACLRATGFLGAVTMVGGPVSERTDPFRISRVAPRGGEPWALFLLRLSGLYDKVKSA